MKQKSHNSSSQSLLNLSYDAIRKANVDCIYATNKFKDYKKTHGESRLCDYYNNRGGYLPIEEIAAIKNLKPLASYNVYPQATRQWYYCLAPLISLDELKLEIELYEGVKDPLDEKRLADNSDYKRLWYFILQNNLIAKHARYGNCGIRSGIVFSYLWQHATPLVKNIKYLSMSYDHAVVMVNDKWIIDPWYKEGKIYPVSQFEKKALEVRDYCVEQLQKFRNFNVLDSEESFWETNDKISYQVRYEVSPKKLPYPKYAYGMSIEDHFSLRNIYPADIFEVLSELEEEHKEEFQPVLNEFNFFWKNSETHIKPLQAGLFSAVQEGDFNKVLYFLNKGADINYKNNMEYTPLMVACTFEHTAIIKLLVDNGADVNACSRTNLSSLGIAVYQDSLGIAQFLLNNGASSDTVTKGYTLEEIAQKRDNFPMVSLLNNSALVPLPKPSKSFKQSAQNYFQKLGRACVVTTEFMVLGKK